MSATKFQVNLSFCLPVFYDIFHRVLMKISVQNLNSRCQPFERIALNYNEKLNNGTCPNTGGR